MARNIPITSMNGGEIGKEVMLRTSLETYVNSAEIMENIWPEPSGPGHFRPGTKFHVELPSNVRSHGIPFVYDTITYGVLLSSNEIRIEQAGGIITRSAVTATIANGTFPSGLSGWTNISTGGGSAAGSATGLQLTSNGVSVAGVRQAVGISQIGTTHGLRIIVERGPVTLLLGSTAGGEDYVRTELRAGTHSIGVTPTAGTLHIDILTTERVRRLVTSIAVEASGDLVLPTPWSENQLRALRHDQKNDVAYFASGAGRRKRLERRSSSSWSIVDTIEGDGPFNDPNVEESYTLTPSVRSGNGTLTASRVLFKAGHVGALFKLTHSGQYAADGLAGPGQSSDYIKVQGVGTGRAFKYSIAGTFVATVTLRRSIGNTTSWTDVQTFTAPVGVTTFTDGTTFDNQTVYYRLDIKTDGYTSGTANVTLEYTGGSTSGIARVTGYTSPTLVDIEVVETFGAITATAEWEEGAWSDARDWPKAVGLYDGRLWSGGYYDRFYGSKSDAYESHEAGDAPDSAILRTVSLGNARRILSFLTLARLVILTSTTAADIQPAKIGDGPVLVKSSAFDEPLTPTNLTVRESMAARGIYIDADGHQAMEMFYSVEAQDYTQRSLMRLHKDIGRPGIVQIAASMRPFRRLFFVRADGVLLTKLFDPSENTLGWSRVITDGVVESCYVKPAANEDEVMIIVRRTIGGQTKRYLEQFDPMYITSAAAANRVDSYVRVAGAVNAITGLAHLEGKTVKIWIDGGSHPDKVVTGGQVDLDWTSITGAVTGLNYDWRYMSTKPPMAAGAGSPIGQQGRPQRVCFVLENSTRAIEFGGDFTTMDWLHDRDHSASLDSGPGLWSGTTEFLTVPGDTSRDPRLCLRGSSPAPVMISGYVMTGDIHERA
jgi:hypothetical protein